MKDKAFELELSWDVKLTKGRHGIIVKAVREAEKCITESLREEGESDNM